MSSSTPRRLAAVSVLAVTAASGIALSGTAASARTTPKAHTSLSIRAQRTAINPGGGDVIAGDLQAFRRHDAGRRITLRARPAGSTWSAVKRHRTGAHGRVTFQVTPTVTTRYQLFFAGNKRQQASHSGVVTVRVLDTTSLAISLGSRSIDPGQSDTVNGALSLDGAPLVGDTIHLLSATRHHRLREAGSAVTDANGDVSFSVTPAATTRYVLLFRKTADNARARSAEATIRVRAQSSLSIRARKGKHGAELISGELRGGGHGLVHRKITLQDRASGTTAWTTVKSKFTRHGGNVSFSVPAPSASEDYQLAFAGGPVYDGCQSGVVTVTVA
jgi:hypothetical protein